MTASLAVTPVSALLDQLDAVAVGVAHEADPVAALPHAVGRLLRLDALARQLAQRAVEVVDGERDVVVARAELVGVHAVVVGELEPVAVARESHEDVDRLVADRHAPPLLEAERLVELHGAVDVADLVAGVDELHGLSMSPARGPGRPSPPSTGSGPSRPWRRAAGACRGWPDSRSPAGRR